MKYEKMDTLIRHHGLNTTEYEVPTFFRGSIWTSFTTPETGTGCYSVDLHVGWRIEGGELQSCFVVEGRWIATAPYCATGHYRELMSVTEGVELAMRCDALPIDFGEKPDVPYAPSCAKQTFEDESPPPIRLHSGDGTDGPRIEWPQ